MKRKRSMGPLSFVTGMGLALVIASYAVPLFISVHTARSTDIWQVLRLVGWILIAVGVIRTGVLRRRADRVVRAKETAGLRGELETARVLARLGARYRVFNRVYVYHGGWRQEFDHIVVGPNGVFHIESKNWAGVVEISDSSVRRSVQGGDHDAGEQMRRHHALLTNLLHDHGVAASVHGILCFTNRKVETYGSSASYWTVRVDELADAISRHRADHPLGNREIQQVVRLIRQNCQVHKA